MTTEPDPVPLPRDAALSPDDVTTSSSAKVPEIMAEVRRIDESFVSGPFERQEPKAAAPAAAPAVALGTARVLASARNRPFNIVQRPDRAQLIIWHQESMLVQGALTLFGSFTPLNEVEMVRLPTGSARRI